MKVTLNQIKSVPEDHMESSEQVDVENITLTSLEATLDASQKIFTEKLISEPFVGG